MLTTKLLNGVRPDRVYATGVVQPTGDYRPAQDSIDVAVRFANSGQLAPGALNGIRQAQLMGLRGQELQLLGLHGAGADTWTRIKLWFRGAQVKATAAKIAKAAIDTQAAASGSSKQTARALLFATSLPDMNSVDGYPGGAPTGAERAQETFAAEAIVNASGTMQYQNAPITSKNQAAMDIAPGLFTSAARLAASDAPQGNVGRAAVANALQRFFAANKGRVG